MKKEQTSQPANMCEKHGKELILYCKLPECQKAICQTCLTRYHRGHDVVEIEETERETLIEKFDFIAKGLKERKEIIMELARNAEYEQRECVRNITARRKKIIQIINHTFEEMLADVRKKGNIDFREKLTIVKEQSDVLDRKIKHISKEVITHQDIETDMNTLKYVEQSIKDHLSGMWECKVVEFIEEPPFPSYVERLCGYVMERTKYLDMNGYEWKGNN